MTSCPYINIILLSELWRRHQPMIKNSIKINILLAGIFFLLSTNSLAQDNSIKFRVVTDQANIRLNPAIGSVIIHQIPKGTILEATAKEGDWYQIVFITKEGESATGYVHQSLVLELDRPGKETEIVEEETLIETPPRKKPSPAVSAPSEPSPARVHISLSAGGNYVEGRDINKGAEGLAGYYEYVRGIQGAGEVKPAHLSPIFGAELNFPLSSYFFFGIGADYFSAEKESKVEFQGTELSNTYITRPKIQAIPIRAFLSFYPMHFVYIKSGIEYYFAKCTYFYRYEDVDYWQEWRGEAKAQGIGFLGALGFVKTITSHMSFLIEISGRYANIKGFKGTNNYKETPPEFTSSEEGTLYLYQGKISEQKSYPLLFIREKAPTDPGVLSPEEAIIDFSGISIRAGFKISF